MSGATLAFTVAARRAEAGVVAGVLEATWAVCAGARVDEVGVLVPSAVLPLRPPANAPEAPTTAVPSFVLAILALGSRRLVQERRVAVTWASAKVEGPTVVDAPVAVPL